MPIVHAVGRVDGVPVRALAVVSVLAGAVVAGASPLAFTRLPASLDGFVASKNRTMVAVWMMASALAVFGSARIAVFLADSDDIACSLIPADPFLVRHSCLTAYVHGAILSADPAADAYDMEFVRYSADHSLPLPLTATRFEPFTLDAYGYPPPFLLLPKALLLLSPDFALHRILFGAASWLLLMYACARAAGALGGVTERRIWLLTPVFLAHPLVLLTLQVGNFHMAAVALCVLCWVALERRRDGLAGALLGAATLAKIFPGLLGVVLLVHRRWKAVLLTSAAAAALSAVSVMVLGTKVWADFLFEHLPRVHTGEALQFLATNPEAVAFNLAPFGLPFKFAALGFDGWGWPQARVLGNVYSVVVFGLAVLAARNSGSPRHRLTVWLALVLLASLRSPYAAPFVLTTLIVHLLVLAGEVRSRRAGAAFVALCLVFSVPPPTNPTAMILVPMAVMVVLYAFLGWAVLRREVVHDATA